MSSTLSATDTRVKSTNLSPSPAPRPAQKPALAEATRGESAPSPRAAADRQPAESVADLPCTYAYRLGYN